MAHFRVKSRRIRARARTGYAGIISAIFLVLIILFFYFNVYTFMVNRNAAFQDTTSQVAQMTMDQSQEQITISNATSTLLNGALCVKCTISNNCMLSVQVVRLWMNATSSPESIVLQPGEILTSAPFPVSIASAHINDTIILRFVTARGNIFSATVPGSQLTLAGGAVSISVQSPAIIHAGGLATYIVKVTRSGPGTFSALLSVSGLPFGAAGSFNVTTLSFGLGVSSNSSMLTVTTSSSTPGGKSSFNVIATDAQNTYDQASAIGHLTVAFVDSIFVGPQITNPVAANGSTTYAVNVTRSGAGVFSASLSVSGLAAGCSGTFSLTTLSFGLSAYSENSTLTVYTSTNTPFGSSAFTITAINTLSVNDNATGAGSLVVGQYVRFVSVSTQNTDPVAPGSSTTYNVTVQRGTVAGAFSVNLNINSGLPVQASSNSATVSLASGVNTETFPGVLKVTTSTRTPGESYIFVVTATWTENPNDFASGFGSLVVSSQGNNGGSPAHFGLDNYVASDTTSGNTMTLTLYTTNPNDVLYLSWVGSSGQTIKDVSTVSPPSTTTWKQRAHISPDGANWEDTWYAISSAGETTYTINITMSNTAGGCAAILFGVSGANTTTPFDGNARTSDGLAAAQGNVLVTTSNANDLIVGALGVQANCVALVNWQTPIATQIVGASRYISAEYAIETTKQTNLNVGYAWNSGYKGNWAIIADAIMKGS